MRRSSIARSIARAAVAAMLCPIHADRSQQSGELFARDLVALARSIFEAGAIENRDRPVRVFDEARLLECCSRNRDTGPAGAEHHGQKLLRERELVGLDPIARHQEPARATLVYAV